jgi:hypothetical protein
MLLQVKSWESFSDMRNYFVVSCRGCFSRTVPELSHGRFWHSNWVVAEAVRFELTEELPPRQFSRVIRLITHDTPPPAPTIPPSLSANLPCRHDLSKAVHYCAEVSHSCPIRDISGQLVRMPNMGFECRNCAGRTYRFRLCEYR